jgi:5-carboxymethyl-2-hydroxymuconate isomerase
MPHLILEYSKNLDDDVEIEGLMRRVHQTLFSFGLWDISALRTRAEPRERYFVADGDPTHGFVHLMVRIRPGRDEATRKLIGETLLKAMVEYLAPAFAKRQLAVNVEIEEISPTSFLHRTIGT